MKIVRYFPLFLFSLSQGFALASIEEKKVDLSMDEITSLDQLIQVNEERLLVQKQLKEKMKLFQKEKEEFILGNQSKTHAFAMVSTARQILSTVKEQHLSYLFPAEYLEELVFFSSIAGKTVPIKPTTDRE